MIPLKSGTEECLHSSRGKPSSRSVTIWSCSSCHYIGECNFFYHGVRFYRPFLFHGSTLLSPLALPVNVSQPLLTISVVHIIIQYQHIDHLCKGMAKSIAAWFPWSGNEATGLTEPVWLFCYLRLI